MEKVIDLGKFNTLSEISRDIGQVLFAGVVVEPVISQTTNITTILIGLFLAIIFWTFSIRLIKNR